MKTGSLKAGEGRSYWVVGDLYTIKTGGDETGEAFALIEGWVPPGGGPPPHIHRREDEAFYVLEGQIQFHADGEHILATPGTWITLERGSLHHFRNVGSTPAKILILVTPAGLERFFAEIGREATDDRSPEAGTVTHADIERLLATAPKYGLEIQPPPAPTA